MLTFEEPRGRGERSDFQRSDVHSLPLAVQPLWPNGSILHQAVLKHHPPVTSWSVSVCVCVGWGGGGFIVEPYALKCPVLPYLFRY